MAHSVDQPADIDREREQERAANDEHQRDVRQRHRGSPVWEIHLQQQGRFNAGFQRKPLISVGMREIA